MFKPLPVLSLLAHLRSYERLFIVCSRRSSIKENLLLETLHERPCKFPAGFILEMSTVNISNVKIPEGRSLRRFLNRSLSCKHFAPRRNHHREMHAKVSLKEPPDWHEKFIKLWHYRSRGTARLHCSWRSEPGGE